MAPGDEETASLDRVTQRPRLFRGAALLTVVLLAGSACGDGEAASTGCDRPPALTDTSRLPDDAPLPEGARLTEVVAKKGHVTITTVDRTTIKETFDLMRAATAEEGFEILAQDFEGFEAEIFFARESSTAGVVRLRRGPCEGDVTMSLLYDPLDTEQGKKSVGRTRERVRSYDEGKGKNDN